MLSRHLEDRKKSCAMLPMLSQLAPNLTTIDQIITGFSSLAMALITCYAKRNTLLWIFGACLIAYLVLVNPKSSFFLQRHHHHKGLYGFIHAFHPACALFEMNFGMHMYHGKLNC
jgi:hypothetical protein